MIIGQEKILNALRINAEASKLTNTPLPHMLFVSGYGMGKTTLAKYASELVSSKMVSALGSTLKNADDATSLLSKIAQKTVLFIDEVHSINPKAEEVLYIAMENGFTYAGGEEIKLPPFTLICATTKEELLSKPFKSRFQNIYRLEAYTYEQIGKIVLDEIKRANKGISKDAVRLIVRASKLNPRSAVNLSRNSVNYSIAMNKSIDYPLVEKVLIESGVDRKGYNAIDREYLKALNTFKKPTGLSTIASFIGVDRQTIVDDIEPNLIKKGLISLTSRGRELVKKNIGFV